MQNSAKKTVYIIFVWKSTFEYTLYSKWNRRTLAIIEDNIRKEHKKNVDSKK